MPKKFLPETHPLLAKQWHPTKNVPLSPNQITYGSGKNRWWKCPKGPDHEWEASPNSRTNRKAKEVCPFCVGLRVSITNSLATLHPEIARELHPTMNPGLTADKLVAGSTKTVWWKCPKGPDHEWPASLNNRTNQNTPSGCPCCSGHRVRGVSPHCLLFQALHMWWQEPLQAEFDPLFLGEAGTVNGGVKTGHVAVRKCTGLAG